MPFFPPPFGAGGLAPWQTQTKPNATDLYTFLTTVAGIPTTALPSTSGYIAWALSYSEEQTLLVLRAIGQDYYCFAVYLLATSFLINWCPDQPGQTFFVDLRKSWNISGFVGGIVSSTADQGTSESMDMPDFIKGLTLAQLQAIKDQFGRQWLAMSQDLGPVWGIS
jgi:hypothetical protein